MLALTAALNLRELRRYLNRIGDRWPLQVVLLGGSRVAEARAVAASGPEPEYVMILVSDGFDGMPWLERVYQASALWDALEMGGAADIHCYTAAEFQRRRASAPAVRRVVEQGVLLFEDSAPPTSP